MRRLLSFRKYSSVVVSVFVCTPPACRTPWHAFWVSESHNLLLEFGRHSKGCIFLFCKIEAAFKILRIHVAEKEPGMLTCDSEPMTSRSLTSVSGTDMLIKKYNLHSVFCFCMDLSLGFQCLNCQRK